MKETIAVGTNGTVAIWASLENKTKHAHIYDVINGEWVLTIDRAGKMSTVFGPIDGEILWRGYVPREHSNNYNTAIKWIQEQIDENRSS